MLPVECIFTTSEWQILILGGKILFPMVNNMTWFFSPIKSTDANSALFSRYKHWQ